MVRIRGICKECKTVLMEFIPEISARSVEEFKQSFGSNCPVCNKHLIIEFQDIMGKDENEYQ